MKALALLLLVTLGVATGCGSSSSGPPTDATPEDFCRTFVDLQSGLDADSRDLDTLHTAADQLAEVGTPADMPDRARDAYTWTLRTVQRSHSESALRIALTQGGPSRVGDLLELADYVRETCPDVVPGDGGSDASVSPTTPAASAG